MSIANIIGGAADKIGSSLNLPEMGISELFGVGSANAAMGEQSTPLYSVRADGSGIDYYILGSDGARLPITREDYTNLTGKEAPVTSSQDVTDIGTGTTTIPTTPTGTSSGTSDAYTPADISYLQGIKQQYENQLGGLDKTLADGNKEIANQYNKEVDTANFDKTKQATDQTTIKGQNYSKINNAANRGYNSLAAILGRASGTGSSAFQKLLPNMIGKDISGKRADANNVYGTNMSNIDSSFASVLADLAEQKKKNEQDLEGGIYGQRADINSKLATTQGSLNYAGGGDLASIRAAQAPYEQQVKDSQNAIVGLFDKYFKPYTPKQAAPAISTYNQDRSQINFQNQGGGGDNPYVSLLRKRLTEQA
ncbi:MAG: hypothetical protein M0R80_17665 [Proteobacteria bacterium]|jgi:hypothetical protein|nr:hypothetical protein [Pseudomonadota bacterium]